MCRLQAATEDAEAGQAVQPPARSPPHLEIWLNDGRHEIGPPVEFEHLDQAHPRLYMYIHMCVCFARNTYAYIHVQASTYSLGPVPAT